MFQGVQVKGLERASAKEGTAAGVSDELVDAMVICLKDAYAKMRRRWRPDFRGVPERHDKQLRPVAEILVKANGNPYGYVHYLFDLLTRNNPDVYINQLSSKTLACEYLSQRPNERRRLELQTYLMANAVKTKLANGFPLEFVVTSEFMELTPIFRYAVAISNNRPDLASRYEDDAKRMLEFEPMYKELLGEWLPEEMRR